MISGGFGGSNTTTGLRFETRVDLDDVLMSIHGYEVKPMPRQAGKGVFFHGQLLARTFKKYEFYEFLEEQGIDWKKYLSKRLLPDNSLLVIVRDTLFIIEINFSIV